MAFTQGDIFFTALFLGLLLAVWWYFSWLTNRRRIPRLFKTQEYPPKTREQKAMWVWWRKMDKIEPTFQWKMPIEFYGKVVDQFGQPVAEAEVELNWETVVGPVLDPKKTIFADTDGRFSVTGIQGKRITIAVSKEGYKRTRDGRQSFEYAAFFENDFHVPDPNNPVVFHLRKLTGAEPRRASP